VLLQADLLAERLRRDAGEDVDRQVRYGFLLALCRKPSAEECTAAVQLVKQHGLPAFCRALFNANEFLFVS